MNLVVEAPRHLVVDLSPEPGQAAERRLDMAAWAAEPVVEVEVPERGIEVIAPHQADHAAAEPDTFRVPGGSIEDLLRLDEFVGLALIVLCRIGGACGCLALGILALVSATLGKDASGTEKHGEADNGEAEQNRILEFKQPSTHKFPDLLPVPRPARTCWFDADQLGPQCGENPGGFP